MELCGESCVDPCRREISFFCSAIRSSSVRRIGACGKREDSAMRLSSLNLREVCTMTFDIRPIWIVAALCSAGFGFLVLLLRRNFSDYLSRALTYWGIAYLCFGGL